MIKLSELQDDTNVVREDSDTLYTVIDIKEDLQDFQDEGIIFYTVTEYHAHIDAKDMLQNAIEREYDNMYEDWDDNALQDITDEHIEQIQSILDDILSSDTNISYLQDKQIDIFN